jgi:hypothetical protein
MYNTKNSLNLCLIEQNSGFLGKNLGIIGFIGFIGITLKNRIYRFLNMSSN